MSEVAEILGLRDVQADLKEWHRREYRTARLSDIGLKLAEEAGEVCRVIDRMHHAKSSKGYEEWAAALPEEIGDVAIVLMVLCARGGLDFEDVVRRRAAEVIERTSR